MTNSGLETSCTYLQPHPKQQKIDIQTDLEVFVKAIQPVSGIERYVPRQHGRSFVWHVREVHRIGAFALANPTSRTAWTGALQFKGMSRFRPLANRRTFLGYAGISTTILGVRSLVEHVPIILSKAIGKTANLSARSTRLVQRANECSCFLVNKELGSSMSFGHITLCQNRPRKTWSN